MEYIEIGYNKESYNLDKPTEILSDISIIKNSNKIIEYELKNIKHKYILNYTYELDNKYHISVKIEMINKEDILKLYIILQYHFKNLTIKDLYEKNEWNYNKWNIKIIPKNKEILLNDHLKLLNFYLNLKDKFNKNLKLIDIQSIVTLTDKRGHGGERPREINFQLGFPLKTHSTNKKIPNSERLFICPFPIDPINPSRKAINPINSENKCFTCNRNEDNLDLFGKKTIFEKGHLMPIKIENTTKSLPQCKWCNTFYKDKITFDIEKQKVEFNLYAILRDSSEKDIKDVLNKLNYNIQIIK
jgi:hypothetical protein